MISIDENARKRFEADWQEGRSLSIREYLPLSSSNTYIGTLEELVCIDMEFRWRPEQESASKGEHTVSVAQAAIPTRVEDYVREFPELDDEQIIQRLVEQEIYVRVNAGYVVEPSEYQSRFPRVKVDDSMFSQPASDQTRADPVPFGKIQETDFPVDFGPYTLTSQLGLGGMGAVYRATQKAAGREVALKIASIDSLRPESRQQIVERFQKEAQAAASLEHDHVVPIFDVGVVDDKPYMAMQLIEGGDLGSRSKGEPLPCKQAVEYLAGVTRGIEKAHQLGLLHRDIKPANVLVDPSTDRAMLTDFGLVRSSDDDAGMTQTGQLLGTPSFMPPEQIRDSSKIDVRADVYSLGGTLYQLVTGRPPYKAADMHETLRQVISADAVAPRTVNPDVDRELNTICLKCLEKDPDARYQTASQLAQDLELYLAGKPILARPAGPVRRLVKWCQRNKALAAAQGLAYAALLTAAIVGVTGYVMVKYRSTKQSGTIALFFDGYGSVLSKLQDEPGMSTPDMEPIRAEFLETMLEDYEKLSELTAGDTEMRDKRALALAAAAQMKAELRYPAEVQQSSLAAAVAAIKQLPPELQETPEMLASASNLAIWQGRLAAQGGELQNALEHFREAVNLRGLWLEASPKDSEARRKLANAVMNEAVAMRKLAENMLFDGQQEEGRILLAQVEGKMIEAQKLRALIPQPQGFKVQRDVGKAHFNLGTLELLMGDVNESVIELDKSSEIFQQLAYDHPADGRLWENYVDAKLLLADLYAGSLQGQELEVIRQEIGQPVNAALNALDPLLQLREQRPVEQLRLASKYQQGIDILLSSGDFELAQEHYDALQARMRGQLELEADKVAGAIAPTNSQSEQPTLVAAVSEASGDERQSSKMWSSDALRQSHSVFRLNHLKHQAFLATWSEPPDVARETLQKVVSEFEANAELVASDRMLAFSLSRLKEQLSLFVEEPSSSNP